MERTSNSDTATQQSLADRFFGVAKMLLEREQGRASVPTAQALMLMLHVTACQGRDRAGLIYRQYALDMVVRLKLEDKYSSLLQDERDRSEERRLLSHTIWGLFVFET